MKLRTFEGEPVQGELTTEYPVSRDRLPVLVVTDEPVSPDEGEFFLRVCRPRGVGVAYRGRIQSSGLGGMKNTKKPRKLVRVIIGKEAKIADD